MIDLDSIDLSTLPSAKLPLRVHLPECSGIYFCLTEANKPVYVGKAENFRVRWKCHEQRESVMEHGAVKVALLEAPVLDIRTLERWAIRVYRPHLNRTYKTNWNKSRAASRENGQIKKPVSLMLSQECSEMLTEYSGAVKMSRSDFTEKLIRRYGVQFVQFLAQEIASDG